MKTLLTKTGYKLSALLLLLTFSQTALWAEDGKTAATNASLSGGQVVGLVALLIAIVVIPAFKSSRRVIVK